MAALSLPPPIPSLVKTTPWDPARLSRELLELQRERLSQAEAACVAMVELVPGDW